MFSSRGRVRPTRVSRARPRRRHTPRSRRAGSRMRPAGRRRELSVPGGGPGGGVELCPPDPATVAARSGTPRGVRRYALEKETRIEMSHDFMRIKRTNVQERHSIHTPQSWRTRAQTTVTVRATALRSTTTAPGTGPIPTPHRAAIPIRSHTTHAETHTCDMCPGGKGSRCHRGLPCATKNMRVLNSRLARRETKYCFQVAGGALPSMLSSADRPFRTDCSTTLEYHSSAL